jgi:hypothetical protein
LRLQTGNYFGYTSSTTSLCPNCSDFMSKTIQTTKKICSTRPIQFSLTPCYLICLSVNSFTRVLLAELLFFVTLSDNNDIFRQYNICLMLSKKAKHLGLAFRSILMSINYKLICFSVIILRRLMRP